ncbi:MAG: undecaprenyl/decaprenyl-phosphate alpha-N-acetylglucosaminyl 1-phosphate transferase, partial [Planctomycetes bacterium]|nr:undecaprenyl/decaprenyl-phosphate alpha-N-acetylglucosaminyl 1-phosphate transferase [Planctomycetota bacterium]
MRIVDKPGTRKVHSTAVPRIGGLAVMLAAGAVVLIVRHVNNEAGRVLLQMQPKLAAILIACVFICLVGLIDDIWTLRARFKLLGQIIAALGVCSFGIRIDMISLPGTFAMHLGWLSWPVTVFWIVGITNAVNLIDGLDGLAGGISAIACGILVVFAFYTEQVALAVLMLVMAGSLAGFLFFNFHPAGVFLGDCGSMFLGFFLATGAAASAPGYRQLGMALLIV